MPRKNGSGVLKDKKHKMGIMTPKDQALAANKIHQKNKKKNNK